MQRRSAGVLLYIIIAISAIPIVWQHKSIGGYIGSRFLGNSEKPVNEIVVWHPWGGTQKELMEKVFRRYEKAHEGIRVRPVYIGYASGNNQKLFTAIAANRSPNVAFVAGQQIAELADQGALRPLDSLIERSGIVPEDFFEPCWIQCNYDNQTWALTYCADPNFAFAWNKEVFRRNGLNPDRGPRTIDELDAISDKLTKRNSKGDLETIGIIPWGQFGLDNSIFTWGWIFGGSFYDSKNQRITANDPRIVKALEWMCSYAGKYDITRINSFSQGFGSLSHNPFYIGQLGMTCFHISWIEDASRYAPNLDYGLSPIPYPPGGEADSCWMGGWCLALPKGSKNIEQSWEFIRWLCADPIGTSVVGKTQDLFPGYRKSLFFGSARNNPRFSIFLSILEGAKHQRPVMPAEVYYEGALSRAVEQAIYGLKTPKQALDDATAETQRELDLRLAGR